LQQLLEVTHLQELLETVHLQPSPPTCADSINVHMQCSCAGSTACAGFIPAKPTSFCDVLEASF
jgi:hypothetical protein